MTKNKIFIDNFGKKQQTLGLRSDSGERHTMVVGIHHANTNQEYEKNAIIKEVLNGLLLHDILVIRTENIVSIISAFGLKDTLELVKTNRFELIDDLGNTPALSKKNDFSLTYLQHGTKNGGKAKNSFEFIESRFKKLDQDERDLLSLILLNLEKSNIIVDTKFLNNKIDSEINYDLQNLSKKYQNFTTESKDKITELDVYNVLRLSELNKSLIYSSHFQIDNISIDGAIKDLVSEKLSPMYNEKITQDLSNDFFKNIFHKKNIPSLVDLYLKKIITIHDYIDIISTLGSKKFRHWIMEKDYSSQELEKDILSSNPKISNKYIEYIRWGIPNTIGLVLPAVGIASSFTDSFLIDKLMKGWHPNLFLDEVLKQRTDKFIENHKKRERIESIKQKFPNIGRNDLCPCGSKVKFKKCCGK